jgi:hypothetical protein
MRAVNSVRGSIRLRHVALEKIILIAFISARVRSRDAIGSVLEQQQKRVRVVREIDEAPSLKSRRTR